VVLSDRQPIGAPASAARNGLSSVSATSKTERPCPGHSDGWDGGTLTTYM